jgi:hypothetical protein
MSQDITVISAEFDTFLTERQTGKQTTHLSLVASDDVDLLVELIGAAQARSADSAFLIDLGERLNQAWLFRHRPTYTPAWRRVGQWLRLTGLPGRIATASALVMMVLIILLVVIPPSRTWAQDSISAFLSRFGLTRTTPILPVATPAAEILQDTEQGITDLPRDSAQLRVRFKIKAPMYLPADYQPSAGFEVHEESQWVFWRAWKVADPDGTCTPSIRFSQAPASGKTTPSNSIGDAHATVVRVNEDLGLWIEKRQAATCTVVSSDKTMRVIPQFENVLTWEHDGIHYTLSGDFRLSFTEMRKVAESLK